MVKRHLWLAALAAWLVAALSCIVLVILGQANLLAWLQVIPCGK